MRKRWLLGFVFAVAAVACLGSIAFSAPILRLRDLNGTLRQPLAGTGKKAIVLLFLGTDCPISNSYAPVINRLCTEYASQISFYIVHAEPDLTAAVAAKHALAFRYRCPVLLDTETRLAQTVGATVTPEAVVLSPRDKMLYRGRIDNKYIDFGKARVHPTTHDLQTVLDAVLQGNAVPNASAPPVGCFIVLKNDPRSHFSAASKP